MEVNAFQKMVEVLPRQEWLPVEEFARHFVYWVCVVNDLTIPLKDLGSAIYECVRVGFIEHNPENELLVRIKDTWYDQPI